MKFFKTRRELIAYLLNEGFVDRLKITAKTILKLYREKKKEFFCAAIFRDDCYEKFWLIGYEVCYKQTHDGDEMPEISAPANAMSRMCGELANLYQEGCLRKIGRGLYAIDKLPVEFPKSRKKEDDEKRKDQREATEKIAEAVNSAGDVIEEVVDDMKEAASELAKDGKKVMNIMKVATEAAAKAVQEALKK